MVLATAHPDPGADYGEVFTRRWVVELILDLVGYQPQNDLGGAVLVEPSCGTGAFLLPVIDRLIESCRLHGRDLQECASAIQAFDLLDANAERARKATVQQLTIAGLEDDDAEKIARRWVTTGDFLLHDHESAAADFVVGNPPYIRLESVPRQTMSEYRLACPSMRGRADIYVGFIEKGLQLLKDGGALSFICADRWMRNQYGADLRELVSRDFAVDAVISMHDVDAFEDDVSAYPAVVVVRRESQTRAAVVDANGDFGDAEARKLSKWIRSRSRTDQVTPSYEATKVDGWFSGRDLWPSGSPTQLALIADLEKRFPLLEDPTTGTRVGIGVATGCDDVFITRDPTLVEDDRLLPLLQASDTTSGYPSWSGTYLVNPWNDEGIVDLDLYPRMASRTSCRKDPPLTVVSHDRSCSRSTSRKSEARAPRPEGLCPSRSRRGLLLSTSQSLLRAVGCLGS
jgi:adenine-specific DNA-methyltransferase